MRDLTAEKNIIEVYDGISGDVHELYFRPPSTDERAKYLIACVERSGSRVLSRRQDALVSFGAAILTGFKKGTFCIDGKVFSSDPLDGEYREDWRELLVTHSGEICAEIGYQVFEKTVARGRGATLVLEDDDVPLSRRSETTF